MGPSVRLSLGIPREFATNHSPDPPLETRHEHAHASPLARRLLLADPISRFSSSTQQGDVLMVANLFTMVVIAVIVLGSIAHVGLVITGIREDK